MEVREMKVCDYESVIELWRNCEGLGVHDFETKEWLGNYLSRNPGMSFVAVDNDNVIGAVLCGHEGRRGYLNHLGVTDNYREKGVAKALINAVENKLRQIGIRRCNAFVFRNNKVAIEFYRKTGFNTRDSMQMVSKDIIC